MKTFEIYFLHPKRDVSTNKMVKLRAKTKSGAVHKLRKGMSGAKVIIYDIKEL